ncbi:MAG: MMCAP2_0565 family pilin-like conjugal transfer protein [Patescibacteria group bacterium]
MKHSLKVWAVTAGTALVALPAQVLATSNPFDTAKNLAAQTGGAAGIEANKGLPEIVGGIINVFLGFLGIIFMVLLLYAGFLWMTAQGEDAKVKKARDMITQAVIGLIIVVAAFAISNFILGSLVNVSQ